DGAIGQLPDFGQQLRRMLRHARVDNEHAIVSRLDEDVAAGADDEPDLALHVKRVEVASGAPGAAARIGRARTRWRRRAGAGREGDGSDGGEERGSRRHLAAAGFAGFGSLRSFSMYSGYVVSAPPSAPSSGIPYLNANSPVKGNRPGR